MADKSKLVFLPFLVFLSFFFPSSGSTTPVSSFLHQIEAAAATTHSFSCDFIQEKHLAMFQKPVMFKGSIAIVRPDKLRWEFTEPLPSALLLNGVNGMRCNEGAPPQPFTLDADPIMKIVAEQLWSWLGGNYTRLEEIYTIELAGPTTLRLTPKEKTIADFIATITIFFDRTTLQPASVEIQEASGDSTRLFFSHYRLNIEPAKGLFNTCETRE